MIEWLVLWVIEPPLRWHALEHGSFRGRNRNAADSPGMPSTGMEPEIKSMAFGFWHLTLFLNTQLSGHLLGNWLSMCTSNGLKVTLLYLCDDTYSKGETSPLGDDDNGPWTMGSQGVWWLPVRGRPQLTAPLLLRGYFFLTSRFESSEAMTVLRILSLKNERCLEWLTFERKNSNQRGNKRPIRKFWSSVGKKQIKEAKM